MKNFFKRLIGTPQQENISLAPGSRFEKAPSAQLHAAHVRLETGTELILGENTVLENIRVHVLKGKIQIHSHTRLGSSSILQPMNLFVENGSLEVADHSIIRADISVRFGGNCHIGKYTGVMQGTEIRCDEKVNIGDYVMISYECMIYDTNTHVQYPPSVRRAMTEKSFPHIGAEHEKPTTSAVTIGNDCWLGKRAVILKGVTVGQGSTVATHAVLTKSCPPNYLVYGNPATCVPK